MTDEQTWMLHPSPLGPLLLAADAWGVCGLWMENQAFYGSTLQPGARQGTMPVLEQASGWLDAYFDGAAPSVLPPVHLIGTVFQRLVWQQLQTIPYGCTTTYGALAALVAERQGRARQSARAVGQAVGRNPVSILVPCHRVLGANGAMTGYAGGTERKRRLLNLEQNHKFGI